MVTSHVQLIGQDRVMRHLKNVSNPKQLLDNAIKRTAQVSRGELARATQTRRPQSTSFNFGQGSSINSVFAKNLSTGNTARAWTNPFKVTDGYIVENATKAGRYSLADILDRGRRALDAAQGKAFYIPLSSRGRDKAPGAKPEGLKFGKDYIYTKHIKAFAGYHYLQPIVRNASRYLTRNIIDEIRKELAS